LSDISEDCSVVYLSRHILNLITDFQFGDTVVIPATAYELLLKSYGWYFNMVVLKSELSIIYSPEE
jgi:hypothetical protein